MFLIFYTFVSGILASNQEVVFERSVLSTRLTRDNYRDVFDLGEVKQTVSLELRGRQYVSEETTRKNADFVFNERDEVVSGEFFHSFDLEGDDQIGAMSYISRDADGRYVRTITDDHSEWDNDYDSEEEEEIDPSWWRKTVQKRRALSENIEFSIKWYYTPAAVEEIGGMENLEAKLLLAMSDMNQAYANSGLDVTAFISGDLVEYTTEIDNDWHANWAESLSDEELEEGDIMALLHGADDQSGCGTAYTIPSGNKYWASQAFFKVRTSCLLGYTPTHEVGHLMGLGHNAYTSHCDFGTGCGNIMRCGDYWTSDGGLRTIMSYTSKYMYQLDETYPGTIQEGYPCSPEEKGSELRVGYFSSPELEVILEGETYVTGTDMSNAVATINHAVSYIAHYSQEGATDEICEFDYVTELSPSLEIASVEDLVSCMPYCQWTHMLNIGSNEVCGLSNGVMNGWYVENGGTVAYQEDNVDNGAIFGCYITKSCQAVTSSTTTTTSASTTTHATTSAPSVSPSTAAPTDAPTFAPTTAIPTFAPTTATPTEAPVTSVPTDAPTFSTTEAAATTQAATSGLNLVGSGWCRPGCLSSSCKVNGFRKDNSNFDECFSTCLATEGCVGFAISDADHSYPNRCYVHGMQGIAVPSGWTPYVKSHYVIEQASGANKVSCYNLDSAVTTAAAASTDAPAASTPTSPPASTESPTVPATQPPTDAPELDHFDFVGEGYCRPGCTSSSCKVNGFRKDESSLSECISTCLSTTGCVGFAFSSPDHPSFPSRCYVYGVDGISIPSGWTPYVKQYYTIENASGANLVGCYKLNIQPTTLATTSAPPNCPAIVSFDSSSVQGIWAAENVANTGTNTFWMSASNSGNPEWVSFEYSEATIVTNVEIKFASGRQGFSPVFQGSNDNVNWDDLVDVANTWECPTAAGNQRVCEYAVTTTQAYQFYRYHSDAQSAFVLLNHVVPTCLENSNPIFTRRLLGDFIQGFKKAEINTRKF